MRTIGHLGTPESVLEYSTGFLGIGLKPEPVLGDYPGEGMMTSCLALSYPHA